MKCPKCQFENPAGTKFCNECGNKLEVVCPRCTKPNSPGSKFCGECGQSLTSPEHGRPPKDLSFDEKLAKIQKYLPSGLTEKILSQRDRIEGERRHVTIMFIDMKGLTSLTEQLGRHSTRMTNQASYKPFQSGCRMPEAILAIEQKQASTIQDRSPLTIWGVARRVG